MHVTQYLEVTLPDKHVFQQLAANHTIYFLSNMYYLGNMYLGNISLHFSK